MRLHYTLNPVTLELLCKRKINLNQFTMIAAPPSRWGEGGVYWLHSGEMGEASKRGMVEGMVKSYQINLTF